MPIVNPSTHSDLPANRATRRRMRPPRRRAARSRTAWRTGLVAAAATTALIGTAGAPMAAAADTASKPYDITIGGTSLRDLGIDITKLDPSNPDLSGIDFQKVLALLDNPAVRKVVESCRTGALGSGGGGGGVDCSGSTGTGAAVLLPNRIDVASIADQISINLGPRAGMLGIYVPMGEQTPFGILSVLGATPGFPLNLALGAFGLGDIDPLAMGRYQTLEQVKAAAALPVVMEGWLIKKDKNLAARTEALKIASILTGKTYDYTKPTVIDAALPTLSGTSTILGDGVSFALSRNGGAALAETRNKLALALAGADGAGAASKAYANLGLALALNMNTSTMGLDWFGSPLNFDKVQDSQVIEKVLKLAKTFNMLPAGMNLDPASINSMLDLVDKLKLPDVKEVSCLGVGTSASSSGLGECGNALGLFDYYKDLRAAKDGQSRQTQWGLTDPTSLFLGKGNALGQVLTPGVLQLLTAIAGGDLSKVPFNELTGLMQNPFVKDAIEALLSEEKRLTLTKDFVRFTQDVRTTETSHPVVDETGAPVLDASGKPTYQVSSTSKTSYLLTSDYGLRSPITVDWLGYRLTVFPSVEVNGTVRPNYIGLPTITKITNGSPSLLPKIGLIELDNPFGLGTLPILPFDPFGALGSWAKSVTVVDDVNRIRDALPAVVAALPKSGAPTAEKDGTVPVTAAANSGDAEATAIAAPPEPRTARTARSVAEVPVTAPTTQVEPTPTTQSEKPADDAPQGAPTTGTPTAESPTKETPTTETPATGTPAQDVTGTTSKDTTSSVPAAEPSTGTESTGSATSGESATADSGSEAKTAA